MGIRFPSVSLTRYSVMIIVQLIVNVSLAVWLYSEYLHNPFMQTYVENTWSAVWPEVIGAAIVAGALFALFVNRRGGFHGLLSETNVHAIQTASTLDSLTPIDVCPFCEVTLKTISEGRLQCRNCKRYFKSSMPKVFA